MCKFLDEIEKRGETKGEIKGKSEGRMEGLQALVSSLKVFLTEFEDLYQAVIKNPVYADVSRDQVRIYLNSK